MAVPMPSEPQGPFGRDGAFICGHFAKEPCVLVPFGQERCKVIFKYYRGLQVREDRPPNEQYLPALASQMSRILLGFIAFAKADSVSLRAHLYRLAFPAVICLVDFAFLHVEQYSGGSTEGTSRRILTEQLHALQIDFKKARRQDRERIKTRLKLLTNKDASTLTASLLYKDANSSYPVKELATAFTLRVRSLDLVPEGGHSDEVNSFLRTAATLLQHLAERPPDYEIPPWSITSFDVTFDADERRVVGRGGFGRVVEGEWNRQLVAVKEITKKTDSAWVMDLHNIAVGMIYLHKQSIIHADLKAVSPPTPSFLSSPVVGSHFRQSNILIGPAGEALIADFGLSQVQDQVSSSVHVTRTSADRVGGTFRWMAPEVLLGRGVNKPVDLYGFALIAWELYMGGAAVPFGCIVDAMMFKTLVQQGERPERPSKMGDEMWGLVQTCWRGDPCERPDFVEVERTLVELKSSHAGTETEFF
ncbi:hypothetical protein DXG03_005853 [Asterophora parasitica]|uniref:Protein kinase domain-containing protein n=1 Tax=Asterophora parasitica TaxID=117018 RepID=A0A9P7FZ30_9AGAR|nr:hypothetical protein DXG03_005853 [Asterophora parasitica]